MFLLRQVNYFITTWLKLTGSNIECVCLGRLVCLVNL